MYEHYLTGLIGLVLVAAAYVICGDRWPFAGPYGNIPFRWRLGIGGGILLVTTATVLLMLYG